MTRSDGPIGGELVQGMSGDGYTERQRRWRAKQPPKATPPRRVRERLWTVPVMKEVERVADLIHEARCGAIDNDAEEHRWGVTHREWDVATAKALRLLGVGLMDHAVEP